MFIGTYKISPFTSSHLVFQIHSTTLFHPSIILPAHYLRILLLFTTATMLIPRPIHSPDSPVDEISSKGTATIILVLGILVFLGLTYAIQNFMARLDDKGNRRPVAVRKLVDT
jgi:hypothetical protein